MNAASGSEFSSEEPGAESGSSMQQDCLLLGVDGGGTRCRARLTDSDGITLGCGESGPANIRLGLDESFSAVREATDQCLQQANLEDRQERIVACLALAGASEPVELTKAQAYPHAFRRVLITSDARAACIGAHGGRDGGVVIIGTGSIGWAVVEGKEYRVGGWGFPVSDEGSGAWLGCEALRRVLWAHDGLLPWTGLLRAIFESFHHDPHGIVRYVQTARPRALASFAPAVVEHANKEDPVALDLMHRAGGHIEAIAMRLKELAPCPLALMGGLADRMRPYLPPRVTENLVPPAGDALSGALQLARREAERGA